MARYTFDVMHENDLNTMLRDHMAAVESRLDTALFTGPTPLLNERLEPWSLMLLVELAVRHTKGAEIPRAAVMMLVSRTLGIPTIRDMQESGIAGGALAGSSIGASIGASIAQDAARRAAESQRHVSDARPLDFTGSGVDPNAKVRVVRAGDVTTTVMTVLSEHPLTKHEMHDAEKDELQDLWDTLNTRIAAMIGEGLN